MCLQTAAQQHVVAPVQQVEQDAASAAGLGLEEEDISPGALAEASLHSESDSASVQTDFDGSGAELVMGEWDPANLQVIHIMTPLQTTTELSVSEQASVLCAARQALQMAEERDMDSPGWEVLKKAAPKALQQCTVSVRGGKKEACTVRVECIMTASQQQVVGVLRKGEGAPKSTTVKLLEEVNDAMCIQRVMVKVPLIKDRDFVACQWIDEADPTTTVVVKAAVPPSHAVAYCPESKKHVRGTIVLQCAYVTALGESQCAVKWISCVDAAGAVVCT